MLDKESRAKLVTELLSLCKVDGWEASICRAPCLKPLEQDYWERASKIVSDVFSDISHGIIFNKHQRILLDLGVVDDALLENENESLGTELLKELYSTSSSRICYMSQWLSERYKNFASLKRIHENSKLHIDTSSYAERINEINDASKKVLGALRPLLQSLPGFTDTVITLLCDGKLDRSWQDLAISCKLHDSDTLSHQRDKIIDLRRQLIDKAKFSTSNTENIELFDSLSRLDADMSLAISTYVDSKRTHAPSNNASLRHDHDMSSTERIEFISSELRLIKSLLHLGSPGAGIIRTYPIFIPGGRRTNKISVIEHLSALSDCDELISEAQTIMIAPFTGVGFFEWDRDTVFVPVTPTKSRDDSIVSAFANYRIMVDSLHNNQMLRKSYEAAFGVGTDYRSNFLRDYKAWVTGIGRGFRGALDHDRYIFFRDRIGPHADRLFSPRGCVPALPDERTHETHRLRLLQSQGEARSIDCYRLAVLYWLDNQAASALSALSLAVKINPLDPRSMFALGFLCWKVGINDKARLAFEECLNIGQNTLWQVYALDLLTKI